MAKQHTLQSTISLSGIGLHTGASVTATLAPAPENHGYVFQRTDLENKPLIHANVDFVSDTSRGTNLKENGAVIQTVEHVLAALAGLGVDNVLIGVNGPELPILEGSAMAYVEAIQKVGMVEQEAERVYFEIESPVHHLEPDTEVELMAFPGEKFHAAITIDYESVTLKPQQARLTNMDQFVAEIAPSRTFCFLHELKALREAGLAQGGSLDNAVVVVDRRPTAEEQTALEAIYPEAQGRVIEPGILNPGGLHHDNEPARHKLLDLIGDLALIGKPLKGRITANRPGHKANVALAKKIKSQMVQQQISRRFQKNQAQGLVFDINAIQEILPHRYPFLLIDRITSFTEDTIVGIKNVTFNEPFFQGHFPGNPIMPGVLQIEAMAQAGGILLLNNIENPKSIWVYIVAVDNARFKKPVVPGDTLVFELKMTAMRRSICKMSGKAYVDGKVVCEADLTASVVPKDKL